MTQPTLTIRLNPADTVVVARADILPGTSIPGENVVAKGHIPAGHKISTHQIAEGEPVRRYGQIIGFASRPIAVGDHVHTHNCAFQMFERKYEFCVESTPTPARAWADPRSRPSSTRVRPCTPPTWTRRSSPASRS